MLASCILGWGPQPGVDNEQTGCGWHRWVPRGSRAHGHPQTPVRPGETQGAGTPRAGGSANTGLRRGVLPAPPRLPLQASFKRRHLCHLPCVFSWSRGCLLRGQLPPLGLLPRKTCSPGADFPEQIWERLCTSLTTELGHLTGRWIPSRRRVSGGGWRESETWRQKAWV